MYSDDENAILLQIELEDEFLGLLFHIVANYQTENIAEMEDVQLLNLRIGKAYCMKKDLELSGKDAVSLICVLCNEYIEQTMLTDELSELLTRQKHIIHRLEETVAIQNATIKRLKGMLEDGYTGTDFE